MNDPINDLIVKKEVFESKDHENQSDSLSFQATSVIKQSNQTNKLGKLAEAARQLTICRTTEQVINQVLDSSMSAIEAADSGIFYLYDESSGFLKVQSARGFKDSIYAMKVRPGEFVSGKAFVSGNSSIHHTLQESLVGGDNFTPPNEILFYEASDGRTPVSALIAPLKLAEVPIGVIVLDNFSLEYAFTNTDLDLLQLLANQAAIAIDNVRLYEHQTQLVERLGHALRIHNNLTQTVLQGRGIDGIVADLSRLIENPVIFFDRNAEIQSISQPDLPEPLLEWLKRWLVHNIQDLEKLAASFENGYNAQIISGSMQVDFTSATLINSTLETKNTFKLRLPSALLGLPDQEVVSLISPVNVGGDVLGWVIAIPLLKPIDEGESLAIEYAANIFGLECMKQQAIFEVHARSRADLIDDLLAGRLSTALDRRAREFGINFEIPVVCIYIDIDNFSNYIETNHLAEQSVQNIKGRIYQKLDALIKTNNSDSFIGNKSDSFIVFLNLLSAEIPNWKARVRQIASDLQKWIREVYPEFTVSIAISGAYTGSSAVLDALSETQRVLELYQRIGRTNSMFFAEEIGADLVLLQLPDNPRPRVFAEKTLGPVMEYDKTNHTDLLITLATFCANNRSIPDTAKALATHSNTIRYRIDRVNELLDGALKESESFFNIELAIRILRLRGKIN